MVIWTKIFQEIHILRESNLSPATSQHEWTVSTKEPDIGVRLLARLIFVIFIVRSKSRTNGYTCHLNVWTQTKYEKITNVFLRTEFPSESPLTETWQHGWTVSIWNQILNAATGEIDPNCEHSDMEIWKVYHLERSFKACVIFELEKVVD